MALGGPRMQPLNSPRRVSFVFFFRLFPVVVRAGFLRVVGAHVSTIFHARDIGRVGEGEEGVGTFERIQLDHAPAFHHLGAQAIRLLLRTVAPDDLVRFREGGNFRHPGNQLGMFDVRRRRYRLTV